MILFIFVRLTMSPLSFLFLIICVFFFLVKYS